MFVAPPMIQALKASIQSVAGGWFSAEAIWVELQHVASLMTFAFVLVIDTIFLALVVLIIWWYLADRLQTSHAIRRNYPVLGRFRYWLEHMGEFFATVLFLPWTGRSSPLIEPSGAGYTKRPRARWDIKPLVRRVL